MTIQEFVAALNLKFNHTDYEFTADKPGAVNVRIVRSYVGGGQRSVFCFIERETGDILKAASWKAPAKGVRGNLATVDMSKVDPYGSWLYIR